MTVTHFSLIRDSDCNRKLKNVSNYCPFVYISCFIFYVNMFSIYEYAPNPRIDVSQVLNTVFWLGKAASGCASYSGPTLNLKEFEGLLSQMKVVSEHSEQDRAGRGRRGRQRERQIAAWRRCGGWIR